MTRSEAQLEIQEILSRFQSDSGEEVKAVQFERISVYGQAHKLSRIVIETDVPVASKEAPKPDGEFINYAELAERSS